MASPPSLAKSVKDWTLSDLTPNSSAFLLMSADVAPGFSLMYSIRFLPLVYDCTRLGIPVLPLPEDKVTSEIISSTIASGISNPFLSMYDLNFFLTKGAKS